MIDPQTIVGFAIPQLAISEGLIDVGFDKAKAVDPQRFTLGKPGATTDDLHGTITGDASLSRTWPASNLNVRADFGVSQNVLHAFVLLDALLGAGKQPDGSYSFKLNGPFNALNPTPIAPGVH